MSLDMLVPVINQQADGHKDQGYPAKKAEEKVKHESDLTGGFGHANGASPIETHPKLISNQLDGINPDGKAPVSPTDVSPEELVKVVGELNLTLTEALENRLEPNPAPLSAPVPTPPGTRM